MMHDEILTPSQVARLFGVDVKTVTRWEKSGLLPKCGFKTPGGHRRFYKSEILALIEKNKARES